MASYLYIKSKMEEIQNLFIEYDNAVRDTTEFFNCEKEEIDKKLQQESDDLETLQKKQFTEAIEIYNSRKERLEKSVAVRKRKVL